MNQTNDQRRKERLHAFWKIYREDISWGYLIDLSDTGIKVWLNKEEEVKDDDFSIRILPPKELELDALDFDVHRVWMNPNKSVRFNELGCQFQKLSTEQKEQLRHLIVFFEKYNSKEETSS